MCLLGNSIVRFRREHFPLEPRQVEVLAAFGAVAPLERPVGLHHLFFGKTGQELEGVNVLSVHATEDSLLRDKN